MKSMTELWSVLADELASTCHTSTTHDYKKLVRRVQHEGLSFLTISLPSFGKDFEKALEDGRISDCLFSGFRRKGGLPLFLGGFLRQVFDPVSGVLLAEPQVDSIFAIRQLTLLFGKIQLPCSDERMTDTFWDYVRCEEELRDWESRNTDWSSDFSRIAQLLFSDVFSSLDQLVSDNELVPRHGPGSTSDRIRGNTKFDFEYWYTRMEETFPFGEYALPNLRYSQYHYDRVQFLEPGAEIPVKVIAVPKTLKKPRIIAMEPAHVQYVQQAVLQPMVELLQSKVVSGNTRDNLCFGFLGFRDQVPNRDLARAGSMEGHLATLDLSEASDRVSILHVEALLARNRFLREAVFASRSTKAEIPAIGVDIYSLRKFASMGSALCFPIEAMVFLTTIFMGIERKLGHHLTRKDVKSFRGKVRVYGDDLIVPVDCVDFVIGDLTRLGFKVNANKSFWNGKFRESCGGDYYDGMDVTPIRFRRTFPSSRKDVSEVLALAAFRNLLYERGLWKTASWLDKNQIARVLPHFPIGEPTAPGIVRRSFLPYKAERVDDDTHAPRVRAWVAHPRIPTSVASGDGALLKCLSPGRREPFQDSKHLERSGRPSIVDIKLRWISPF